ncbi:MAG: dephospho-CoA kinase [Thermoplasmata archaeon]|nr:dephospho-CoA kinase [Thermoplasmata archaeon]
MALKRSLIIGRFQPFHEGHAYLVKDVFARGRMPVVAIRDTPYDRDNPFSIYERRKMIHARFDDFVDTLVLPNIDEVIIGRSPGWTIREVEPPDDLIAISGTENRKGFLSAPHGTIVWITGNTGSGKSTLARELRQHMMPCIILDGDEIRDSVSTDLGFSMHDRQQQNIRVALLAKQLSKQGNVIVAVIAPTAEIRERVENIINPMWVYVSRGPDATEETPYEPPVDMERLLEMPKHVPAERAALIVADWLEMEGA